MKARISIAGIPEALSAMRQELAEIIRAAAEDEHPQVARRLRQIAAAFEVGTKDI
jgi:hypothetical protein